MPFTMTASVNTNLPGAVEVAVNGDPAVQSTILRIDGILSHPVRNWTDTGTGLESVSDAEAPLGRAVKYQLLDSNSALLAESNYVTVPAPSDNRSLLRSVLKPTVAWMWCEPAEETQVTWRTSTRSYEIVGYDTPVIVGEVRQRHSGTLSFLCRSVTEANEMVTLLRDGLPMLVRHSPCAEKQTRDILFYCLDIQERHLTREGWRLIECDYQSTSFVVGDTIEPPSSWTFDALAATGTDFTDLSSKYATFADMALNLPAAALMQPLANRGPLS